MNKAIILHGVCDAEEYYEMDFPSPSNAHWIPWLQQKFLRSGVLAQALEMPTPYNPVYAEWKQSFEQMDMTDVDVIVGHSAGCGFILKWLCEQTPRIKLKKLVLVAPWFDRDRRCGDFLKFDLKADIQNSIDEIHVLYADNEDTVGVAEAKDAILDTFDKAQLHVFKGLGHFCLGDLESEKFPPLWNMCKIK